MRRDYSNIPDGTILYTGVTVEELYNKKVMDEFMDKLNKGEVMDWGFAPETNVDTGGFKPFKGDYITRVDTLERKQGTSEKSGKEYDFYTLKVQTVKKLKGEDANKRFLDKIYNPDDVGIKKLANDLFTAGIEVDTSSEEAFEASFAGALDKFITVRAYPKARVKKEGDEWVKVEPIEMVQRWNIPSVQADTADVEAEDGASVPF